MSSSIAIKDLQLSEVLKKLIEVHELTVAELARRVNLPQPTIQRIAAGVYKTPRISTLQPIAEYFDLTINQLRGFETIPYLSSIKKTIKSISLLNRQQVNLWPTIEKNTTQYVISEINLGEKSFAMYMPDSSMDPLIPKGSTLLVDPSKVPHYGSYIVVKLQNYSEVIVRQLITDATDKFIKALSPEFNQLKMNLLTEKDMILGIIVEVRLNCENY